MRWGLLLVLLLIPGVHGCRHDGSAGLSDVEREEGVRTKGGSANARKKMLEKIAVLNTKLGESPARLQRAPDFPSQLKDFTCFQIEKMLQAADYSLATQAQLRMAVKLIEQQPRLMEK
jgi:hypothetical protein